MYTGSNSWSGDGRRGCAKVFDCKQKYYRILANTLVLDFESPEKSYPQVINKAVDNFVDN